MSVEATERNTPVSPMPESRANTLAGVEKIVGYLVSGFLVLFFLYALYCVFNKTGVGWTNHISDKNGFRQAQTAITSYYLVKGGPFLNYETPVLGYPWAVPFEVPLYQWIVAVFHKMSGMPLEQSGRVMSEVFWAGTLVVIWFLLGQVEVRWDHRLAIISLLLISSYYIFWTRAFLIETTALFFCTAFLLFVLRWLKNRRPVDYVVGGLLGVIGALVKVTTFPAFAVIALCVVAADLYHRTEDRTLAGLVRNALRDIVPLLVLFALPVLCAGLWTRHADAIKWLNPNSRAIMSSVMTEWNFGTLEQRLKADTWVVFLRDRLREIVGGGAAMGIALVIYILARKRWKVGLLALLGYLTPLLVFTNLFFVHTYYCSANALFLIMFVGFAVITLLEKPAIWAKILGVVALILIANMNDQQYSKTFYDAQKWNDEKIYATGEAIRKNTAPDEVMVGFGLDWSPEVPYYAERRALLVAEWMMTQEKDKTQAESTVDAAVRRLQPYRVGAVAFCREIREEKELVAEMRRRFGLNSPPFFENDVCSVYQTPAAQGGGL